MAGNTRDDKSLKERVVMFKTLKLPGQPQSMHMGTSYLVNDLWHELQRVNEQVALLKAYEPPVTLEPRALDERDAMTDVPPKS